MTQVSPAIAPRPERRRGSVLLLVVAVLVLLVSIGTAFLVISRTERASTRAMSDVISLDRARDALMANVMQSITATGVDTDSRPLTMPVPWIPGTAYNVGDIVYLCPAAAPDAPGQLAWCTFRCMKSHVAGSGDNGGPGLGANWSTLGAPFYAAARRFDYPEVGQPFGTSGLTAAGFATIPTRDEPWLVQTGDTAHFSQLTAFRYSPLQSDYVVPMPAAPEVSVIDPLGGSDGAYDILPFTTGNGLRYRVSFRVEDESGRANLNVGNTDYLAGGPLGRYLTSYNLFAPTIAADGVLQVRNIHGGVSGDIWGRAPGSAMNLAAWQATVLRYESPRLSSADAPVAFFDLCDELELRTYGVRGGGGIPRPADQQTPTFMYNTFAAGAPTRNFYTTSSFSRDFMPLAPTHGGYTVGGYPALDYPRKISFNIPTPLTRIGAANAALVASNLAAAMEMCGYSSAEARSLAINYVAYKIGSGDFTAPSRGYWLPNGPSFLDGAGIKVRTRGGMADFAGQNDLHTDEPGSAYIGLNAQPFINEIVAQVDPDKGATPVDYAIELANPYPYAIDLAGIPGDANSAWSLEIRDNSQKVLHTISLAKTTGGLIPAHGFYVVTLGAALGAECRSLYHKDPGLILPAKGYVVLKRPVKLAENSKHFDGAAIVDMFGWQNPLYDGIPADLTNYSFQRDNTNLWMSAISFFNSNGTSASNGRMAGNDPGGHSLGLPNNASTYYYMPGTNPAVIFPFFDRAPDAPDASGGGFAADNSNSLFTFADFNRIPRVTNIQRGISASVLSAQLEASKDRLNDPPGPLDQIYWESKVRFDFSAHPDPSRISDPRAVALFECLSPFDRFADTDYSHVEAGDPLGRYRTRIPGRINLNTASLEVLKAIPAIRSIPNLAEAIIAYRDRTGVFASFTFPGVGIRSQTELFVPLSAVMPLNTATMEDRDRLWNTLLNNTTVQSDSFVVYGLIEALRPGDNHTNTDAEWYDPANAHQTVVAHRRFLALVDRSFQNYAAYEKGTAVPRILAIKDLPE